MSETGASTAGRIVAAAALLLLAVGGVLPPGTAALVRFVPGVLALGLVVVAWLRPGPAGGLAILVAAVELSFGAGAPWQVATLLGVGALGLVSRARPALRAPRFPRGRVPVPGTVVCALVTPVALVGWVRLLEPDLHDLTSSIPSAPAWVLVLGGVAFALVNALGEEWVWRGVIQTRAVELYGVAPGIAVQACSFGLAHAWGFPRGPVGVLLAGTWAVMLGILRHRSGGLLAPLLAHMVADGTIAAIVLIDLR